MAIALKIEKIAAAALKGNSLVVTGKITLADFEVTDFGRHSIELDVLKAVPRATLLDVIGVGSPEFTALNADPHSGLSRHGASGEAVYHKNSEFKEIDGIDVRFPKPVIYFYASTEGPLILEEQEADGDILETRVAYETEGQLVIADLDQIIPKLVSGTVEE